MLGLVITHGKRLYTNSARNMYRKKVKYIPAGRTFKFLENEE
jgi:hypothetical protein